MMGVYRCFGGNISSRMQRVFFRGLEGRFLLSFDEVDFLVDFRRRVIAPITTSLVSSTNLKRGGRVNP